MENMSPSIGPHIKGYGAEEEIKTPTREKTEQKKPVSPQEKAAKLGGKQLSEETKKESLKRTQYRVDRSKISPKIQSLSEKFEKTPDAQKVQSHRKQRKGQEEEIQNVTASAKQLHQTIVSRSRTEESERGPIPFETEKEKLASEGEIVGEGEIPEANIGEGAIPEAKSEAKKKIKKRTELPKTEQEESYVSHLQKVQKDKALHRSPLYRFLLQPGESQFREDFLIAGPWMRSLINDKLIVKEMNRCFQDPSCSLNHKEEILKFAKNLMERGIVTKEHAKKLIEIAKQEEEPKLERLIKELESVKPKPLVNSQEDIKYQFKYSWDDLQKELDAIAMNKTSILSAQDRNFIDNFVDDLVSMSTNIVMNIHPTEIYNKAWDEDNKLKVAPNLTASATYLAWVEGLVIEQIFLRDDQKERDRIYATFAKITNELVKKRDYHTAKYLYTILGRPFVERLISKEVIAKSFSKEIAELFSAMKGQSNLIDKMKSIEDRNLSEGKNISYIPDVGILKRLFTFLHDGNPERLKNGEFNFDRIKIAADLHRSLERAQSNLVKKEKLYYHLPEFLQNHMQYYDEDAIWELGNKHFPDLFLGE